jgi:diacylglycerol kinase family enzyme
MRDVGVVVNAHAGRVRRSPLLVDRLQQRLPPNRLAVTESVEEVETALRHFHDAAVDTLCVVGGDGTVTGTLSPLVEVWCDEPLPSVCLLPGGTINTISRSLGTGASPERGIARLLEDGEEIESRSLRILAVRSAADPPRYGMIFGLGVVARWLEHYYAHRTRGSGAAALSVVRSVASVLAGGDLARSLFAPFAAKLESDGEPSSSERLTGLAASVVRDIGLGFRPFFLAGQEPGKFHWISTQSFDPELRLRDRARASRGGPGKHASRRRPAPPERRAAARAPAGPAPLHHRRRPLPADDRTRDRVGTRAALPHALTFRAPGL